MSPPPTPPDHAPSKPMSVLCVQGLTSPASSPLSDAQVVEMFLPFRAYGCTQITGRSLAFVYLRQGAPSLEVIQWHLPHLRIQRATRQKGSPQYVMDARQLRKYLCDQVQHAIALSEETRDQVDRVISHPQSASGGIGGDEGVQDGVVRDGVRDDGDGHTQPVSHHSQAVSHHTQPASHHTQPASHHTQPASHHTHATLHSTHPARHNTHAQLQQPQQWRSPLWLQQQHGETGNHGDPAMTEQHRQLVVQQQQLFMKQHQLLQQEQQLMAMQQEQLLKQQASEHGGVNQGLEPFSVASSSSSSPSSSPSLGALDMRKVQILKRPSNGGPAVNPVKGGLGLLSSSVSHSSPGMSSSTTLGAMNLLSSNGAAMGVPGATMGVSGATMGVSGATMGVPGATMPLAGMTMNLAGAAMNDPATNTSLSSSSKNENDDIATLNGQQHRLLHHNPSSHHSSENGSSTFELKSQANTRRGVTSLSASAAQTTGGGGGNGLQQQEQHQHMMRTSRAPLTRLARTSSAAAKTTWASQVSSSGPKLVSLSSSAKSSSPQLGPGSFSPGTSGERKTLGGGLAGRSKHASDLEEGAC